MRRKMVLSILAIILILLPLSAVQTQMVTSRPLELQAAYGEVTALSITRIAAQSEMYMIGMPFDIEDNFVQYGATEQGREIAKWSILSNTKFKIQIISASPLKHISNEGEELSYILTFDYDMGYVDIAGNRVESDDHEFWFENGDTPDVSENGEIIDGIFQFSLLNVDGMAGSSYIGSVEGSIYFMFTEESSEIIKNDIDDTDLPVGNYSATVTIAVVAEDQ